MKRHGYNKSEVLVIGDDLHSEIKAAKDLDIEDILYDRNNLYPDATALNRIQSFKELVNFI